MNVLLLSSRFPWPPFTGDRLRATIWLEALEKIGDVTLIAPRGEVPAGAPRFRFIPASRSLPRVFRRFPLHTLLAAPYDWRTSIERAGSFDATIVLLSRLDPWVRDLLPDGMHVLDAVDSLGRSMEERAREASPLRRWIWRAESHRVARAEVEAARAYDRVVVVSAEDAAELGAIVISNGVRIAPLDAAPRAYDFGFWGRLAYFANSDAATWLLEEIWPAIRAQRPNATLFLGGADVPSRIRAWHGRNGITIESPVADIAALARNIKVALFPLRYGTGQSNKVLEAAEAGCSIVATSKAMRGLDPLRKHTHVADDAETLARLALAVTSDGKLRAAVEKNYAREQTLDRLLSILRDAEAAA